MALPMDVTGLSGLDINYGRASFTYKSDGTCGVHDIHSTAGPCRCGLDLLKLPSPRREHIN